MILTNSNDRHVAGIMTTFVVVNSVFLLMMPLLPFIDLPNHLSEASIYKFYNKPGNVISSYYQPTPWYFPNTFHTIFCSLFPTVEFGNKAFHIFYIILLPLSIFLVIRELGGNLWYGVLATLVCYGYNVTFGFVGFAISIPTIILLFYLTLLDIRLDRLYLKGAIALTLIVLFLMHAQNALFGALLYGLMILYACRKSFKTLFLRGAVVPLPLIALILYWWLNRGAENEESTSGYLLTYYTSSYFDSLKIRMGLLVFDNFQLREGVAGLLIAITIFAAIILPLFYYRVWQKWRVGWTPERVYACIFFVTAFGCFSLLPDKLPGQTPLAQRFCSLTILSFIVLASLWLNKAATEKLRYYVIASVLIYNVLWFEYMFTFNRVNRGFNENFFSGMQNTSRLAGLIYENSYRGRKVYIHFPNYYLVWKRGITASKIIDYRFGVVRRVASENEIPFYAELIGERYRPVKGYSHLEYLLVRGDAPVANDVNIVNFSEVRRTGPWRLFRNNGFKPASSVANVTEPE